jgi:mRNA interferase YafQ
MLYTTVTTHRFDKDLKLVAKRGKNLAKMKSIMNLLIAREPIKNRDHQLVGNYANRKECHIEPDWLLIYKVDDVKQEIIFERTGTHSDLF